MRQKRIDFFSNRYKQKIKKEAIEFKSGSHSVRWSFSKDRKEYELTLNGEFLGSYKDWDEFWDVAINFLLITTINKSWEK